VAGASRAAATRKEETEMMDPPAPATVVLSCSVGTHGVVS
jgi:hypothetical protein